MPSTRQPGTHQFLRLHIEFRCTLCCVLINGHGMDWKKIPKMFDRTQKDFALVRTTLEDWKLPMSHKSDDMSTVHYQLSHWLPL